MCFKYGTLLLLVGLTLQNCEALFGKGWSMVSDTDDGDVGNSNKTPDDCGRACGITSSCTHYTWVPDNGGTCWMKADISSESSPSKIDPPSENDPSSAGLEAPKGSTQKKEPPKRSTQKKEPPKRSTQKKPQTEALSATWINWNGNNWALACDFNGGDFTNAQVSSSDCGGKCAATSGCTHFTWTQYNGGTCWMKNGAATKNDAFYTGDNSMVCGVIDGPSQINWNGNNWALACDFNGGDFTNAQVSSSDCGGKCAATSGCTHFTWTQYNGGTCWMKNGAATKNDAFYTGAYSMVCGVIDDDPGPVVPILYNVLATRHVNGGGDACALPARDYAITYPFALGDIAELRHLKFKPDLCGHVLNIDCGHGAMNIIITNSNYGGGLDLYSRATWPLATNYQPPGQARCSVQMTSKNPLFGGDNQCFYKPGTGTNNPYYRNIGLLNTGRKIVTGAYLGGQSGSHRGDNPYFAFDLGRRIEDFEQVVFTFNDGSSHTVSFRGCVDVGSEQYWN